MPNLQLVVLQQVEQSLLLADEQREPLRTLVPLLDEPHLEKLHAVLSREDGLLASVLATVYANDPEGKVLTWLDLQQQRLLRAMRTEVEARDALSVDAAADDLLAEINAM